MGGDPSSAAYNYMNYDTRPVSQYGMLNRFGAGGATGYGSAREAYQAGLPGGQQSSFGGPAMFSGYGDQGLISAPQNQSIYGDQNYPQDLPSQRRAWSQNQPDLSGPYTVEQAAGMMPSPVRHIGGQLPWDATGMPRGGASPIGDFRIPDPNAVGGALRSRGLPYGNYPGGTTQPVPWPRDPRQPIQPIVGDDPSQGMGGARWKPQPPGPKADLNYPIFDDIQRPPSSGLNPYKGPVADLGLGDLTNKSPGVGPSQEDMAGQAGYPTWSTQPIRPPSGGLEPFPRVWPGPGEPIRPIYGEPQLPNKPPFEGVTPLPRIFEDPLERFRLTTQRGRVATITMNPDGSAVVRHVNGMEQQMSPKQLKQYYAAHPNAQVRRLPAGGLGQVSRPLPGMLGIPRGESGSIFGRWPQNPRQPVLIPAPRPIGHQQPPLGRGTIMPAPSPIGHPQPAFPAPDSGIQRPPASGLVDPRSLPGLGGWQSNPFLGGNYAHPYGPYYNSPYGPGWPASANR